MQVYGNKMVSGGGYGGDITTPLPSRKFSEKYPTPESPTKLRFPSDIPANKIRWGNSRKGQKLGPRADDWENPLATPQAVVDEMVRLYESGLSAKAVGEKLNRSHTTVTRQLRNRNVKIRHSKKVVDVDQIRRRHANGESIRSIGRAMNLSPATIRANIDA